MVYSGNLQHNFIVDLKTIEDEINQKQFKTAQDKAYINVVYTANQFIEHFSRILKPYDINDQHFNILRILRGRHPECVCPGEIKEVLLNKRGDLTRLLDKLVNQGYVDRHINPENRRMVNLLITDKGLALLKELDEKNDIISMYHGSLTDEEANQLSNLLDKMRAKASKE